MISKEDFKKCLGRFASGVTVITYKDNIGYGGITVSSFTSLSIDPPLILFNINKNTPSHEKLISSSSFAVNLLSSEQEDISNSFASSKIDKNQYLNDLNPEIIQNLPIIKNSLFYLICQKENVYEGGDHSIFIGKVLEGKVDDSKSSLVYYNKGYHKL